MRATQDVDAVAAIASSLEYRRLGDALRARGFSQTVAGGEPPFRWSLGSMKLDLMPSAEAVLGFTNRWYEAALRTSSRRDLEAGISIRLISAPCFLATKLAAFEDRGRGDYLESHDLEDVLSVVDGRPEIVGEMAQADADVRAYVRGVLRRLLIDEGFANALPGLVLDGSPATRVPLVLQRLRAVVDAK